MNKITIKARAKINLTLDILRKRPDGFHEVEMVMQTLELHDNVTLEEKSDGIEVVTDHPLLTAGESNIAYKAADLLIRQFKLNKGVKIKIDKQIPVAAGLAGGSADAAAVLTGLNRLWNLGLSFDELAQLGSQIGSDVPFCIKGGTAVAKGRGEIITPLPAAPEIWMVLAKPPIEVSTAEVYKHFRIDASVSTSRAEATIKAIKAADIEGITENLGNALESVTLNRYPVVSQLKSAMQALGIKKPLMSGSGPSVFGFTGNPSVAQEAALHLQKLLPDHFVTVTRTWPGDAGI